MKEAHEVKNIMVDEGGGDGGEGIRKGNSGKQGIASDTCSK